MKRKMTGVMLTLCMLISMPCTVFAADDAKIVQPLQEGLLQEPADSAQGPGDSEYQGSSGGSEKQGGPEAPGSSGGSEIQGDSGDPGSPGESEIQGDSGDPGSPRESDPPGGSEDPGSSGESDPPESPEDPEKPVEPSEPEDPEEPEEPEYTLVSAPTTSKASARAIRISWDSSEDDLVNTYYVMRRKTKDNEGVGTWKTIAKVKSDRKGGGPKNSYTDELKSSKTQQYEYKICTLSKDGVVDTRRAAYREETDLCAALGTNIKVCIDPGHYESLNNNYDWDGEDGKYPYSEGEFALKIGKALKRELKKSYGIDSYMTRTTERISLTWRGKTYANANLDQGNVSVRGRMAKKKGCDFFISLHTNSTSSPKKIWSQPKSVNKVYIFVNQKAHRSAQWMRTANAIGRTLTKYNQEAGIQTAGFTKRSKNQAALFTNLANDEPDGNGTVVYRINSRGGDYYGVLRGSHEDGVPGILVEHAFHATKAMRKQAEASSELSKSWAACDAYGIARGFGLADAKNNLNGLYSMTVEQKAKALHPDTSWPESSDSESPDYAPETREGWVTAKANTYFYRNGKKQTGWQKIEGRYYYFGKKGVLQKNKIAGDQKSGYYYVDSDGIRVTDTAIREAVKFVLKYSDAKDSQGKRLKSCYNALAEYQYRRTGREKPAAKKMKAYALEMFKNQKGDCYRFAAALAYIARVLGYDSRTVFDNTVTLHGWNEIKTKGKWQTCDCSMRRVDKKNNFFLVSRKTYASLVKIKWGSTVRWDSTYTMHVKNGKVRWK